MQDKPQSQQEKYEYIMDENRPIGKGTFGEVYYGKRTDLQTKQEEEIVAKKIDLRKIVNNSGVDQQIIIKSVQREIEAIKVLKHNNIISQYNYDIDEQNDVVLIYMEKMDGNLNDFLEKEYSLKTKDNDYQTKSYLKPQQIKSICKKILDGLLYLHEQNFIHRDIKPENILFKYSDENDKENIDKLILKISDYGTSKQVYKNGQYNAVVSQKCGTIIFQSIEFIDEEIKIPKQDIIEAQQKHDVFSFGVTLYRLLYNRYPFSINIGQKAYIENMIKESIKFDEQKDNSYQVLIGICQLCLERDYKERVRIDDFYDLFQQ